MAESSQTEDRVRFGIRAKFLLFFLAITTLALAALGGITFFQVSELADNLQNARLDSDIKSIAEKATREIDPQDVLTLLESGEEGDPLYNKLRDQLVEIGQANPLVEANRVYIAVRGENPDEVVFVVDTEESPEEHFALRQVYVPFDTESMLQAFDEPQISEYYIFIDTGDGEKPYAAGYAPLKDVNHNVIGIVGVEMLAESVFDARRDVARAFLLTALGVYPLLVAAILLISNSISRPILDITEVASKLEKDEPADPDILTDEVRRRDELGQLARIFMRAVSEVKAREEQLKMQVAELRIEIDFVKQKTQVDEITDSDFFRDLEEQKAKLRARRRGETGGDKPPDA